MAGVTIEEARSASVRELTQDEQLRVLTALVGILLTGRSMEITDLALASMRTVHLSIERDIFTGSIRVTSMPTPTEPREAIMPVRPEPKFGLPLSGPEMSRVLSRRVLLTRCPVCEGRGVALDEGGARWSGKLVLTEPTEGEG